MGSICGTGDSRTDSQIEKELARGVIELQKKIVIVGAGPAGIHMAVRLQKAGYKDIKILEKTGRICGKSYTVKDEKEIDGYLPVHELGTCYLHPEYHVIEDLIKEYDPDNKMKGVPSRGVFGTHMNEEVENKKDAKPAEFDAWAMNEAEQSSVPKAFHFVHDNITGGLAFVDAVKKYAEIHREIFGRQKNNKVHGFLGRPSEKELQKLNCTMLEWMVEHKVQALIPFFVYAQSVQGYGTLDKIPAYYGLFWNTPELMEAVINVWRNIKGDPNVIVLTKGYESLWASMADKCKLDITINCNITEVNRYLNDDSKRTKIVYEITADDQKTPETSSMECDYLFLACGCKKALNAFLTDATEQEKEVFGPIRPHTVCATLYESDPNFKELENEVAVEVWPKVIWKANGRLYAHRNCYRTLFGHKRYEKLVKKGEIKKDRSVSYQFLNRPPNPEIDGPQMEKDLVEDLTTWGETNVKVIQQECWDYLPIWENEYIMKGYPWIVKDEMQGKYGNTYYIGSSVCFEAVLCVVEYNNELFDTYFKRKTNQK